MATIGTQAVVARERAGEASGVTLAIVIGSAGLAVALAGTIIEEAGVDELADSIEGMLLWLALGSVVLSALLFAWVRRGEAGGGL
jgi:hypothetical protein